jgi:hypothetical protein
VRVAVVMLLAFYDLGVGLMLEMLLEHDGNTPAT